MNRSTIFGGIAALALVLTVVTGAGVALAAMVSHALTDEPSPSASSSAITDAPLPTPSGSPVWSGMPVQNGEGRRATVLPLANGTPSVTDADVRAYTATFPWAADEPENAKVWGDEAIITIPCMAGKGWDYDPRGDTSGPAPGSPAALALGGRTGAGDAYRWQDAGCSGYAVHVTGNDGNN